jgi:hypothetical protein
MASTPSGAGYWLVAADGGVFAFDAPFLGGAARARTDPVMAIVASGLGYLVTARDGDVASFGAGSVGSLASACKDQMFVAATARTGGGAWLASSPVPPATLTTDPLEAAANESDQLGTVLRYRQACQGAQPTTPGLLADPLPGARTTTVFGWRIHPIYGRPQFHTGIDLAGQTRILAADDGVVVEVASRVGYGVTTVIDHGNGICDRLCPPVGRLRLCRAARAAGTEHWHGRFDGLRDGSPPSLRGEGPWHADRPRGWL